MPLTEDPIQDFFNLTGSHELRNLMMEFNVGLGGSPYIRRKGLLQLAKLYQEWQGATDRFQDLVDHWRGGPDHFEYQELCRIRDAASTAAEHCRRVLHICLERHTNLAADEQEAD